MDMHLREGNHSLEYVACKLHGLKSRLEEYDVSHLGEFQKNQRQEIHLG